MAALVVIAQTKGGVGKSTLAVNLACALAGRRTVVVVDADVQGTAAAWAGKGRLPVAVQALALEDARDAEQWARTVRAVAADIIVVDAPPHASAATQAALLIADLVLVPVTPSGADLIATSTTLALVEAARAARGGGKPAALLVPSRVDRRTAAGREIETALKALGERIGPAIGQRSAFVDAFSLGVSVSQYRPTSTAAAEVAALAAVVGRMLR